MSNPFQDQLLKAGLVTKKQVQKAQQDKKRSNKKHKADKTKAGDDTRVKAQQAAQRAAQQKAERDRELNRRKQQQAQQKAVSIEINQLITDNCLELGDGCDIVYNFEHDKKIKRIYVDARIKQKIIDGKLGIARIEGRYELVPLATAEKIRQRNPKRVIILEQEVSVSEGGDYADYPIPDDLTW